MTDNKFGWNVGDALVWSSSEGCDFNCIVTKATAMMIEFETEEGEVKRVKGNNPSIARIDDSPPKTESTTTQEAKAEAAPEPELMPKPVPVPEMAPEPAAKTPSETEKAGECEPTDVGAFVSSGAEEKVSERRAEVDLKSGGAKMVSVQLREGGALGAGDQEFRIARGGQWRPSLEEALDAKYGRRWMCIRWQDG